VILTVVFVLINDDWFDNLNYYNLGSKMNFATIKGRDLVRHL
jgi:hypothetical protein